MRGFLCLAIAAAGCGGDGVHLEVVVPQGMSVERVDLFLAKGAPCTLDDQGTLCDRIAPPRIDPQQPRELIDGFVFEEDATDPLQSAVDGDSAWFFLAPSPDHVKLMIAVGHDGQGTSVGVAVMANPIALDDGDQYLAAELVPAAPVLGNSGPAVEEWPVDGQPYGCVGAQIDNQMPVFIVPKDDPDCDQVPADRECRPTKYLAQDEVSSDLESLSCAVQSTVCVLGDRACNELAPTANTACTTPADVRYCVPDPTCACPKLDAACAQTLSTGATTDPVTISHIACRFATEDVGGVVRVCQDAVIPAKLSPVNHALCGSQAQIADFRVDTFAAFDSSFALVNGGDTLTLQPQLANQQDCQFSLQIPNETFSAEMAGEYVTLVELEMSPDGAGTDFVLLPLTVEIGTPGDCNTNVSACDLLLEPTDQVVKCLP